MKHVWLAVLIGGIRYGGTPASPLQGRVGVVAICTGVRAVFSRTPPANVAARAGSSSATSARSAARCWIGSTDQIHFDGDDRAAMEALMGKHRGFVNIARKEQHRDVFMLGRDNAAVKELGKM